MVAERRLRSLALAATLSALLQVACNVQPRVPPAPASLAQLDPAVRARVQEGLRAVQAEPSKVALWARLGRIYEANRLYSLALATYEGAEALAPRDPTLPYRRAVVLDALERVPEAQASMQRAIDLGADHAPAHWRIGSWRIDAGDLPGARAAFEAARLIDPQDPAAYAGLARVFLLEGESERAATAARSALARRPDDPHALRLLGTALQRAGHDDEAAAAFARAAGRDAQLVDSWQGEVQREIVGLSVTLDAAQAAAARGDLRTAIPILEALVSERPQDVGLLNHLGLGYGRSGRIADALATLQRARELAPRHLLTHLNLAVVCMGPGSGERELALQHLRTALAIDPEFSRARELEGWLLESDGQLALAARAYERTLATDGRKHDLRVRLGLIRLKLSEYDAARAQFEEALRAPNAPPDAWAGLAIAQSRLGMQEAARTSLTRAVEHAADETLVRTARAALEQDN